eukprot:9482997-Pyramimonas_sp.AAC.1
MSRRNSEIGYRFNNKSPPLKPENVLFANDAPVPGNTVKIIDFGLAHPCAEGQVLATKVGTALYVAPEVLSGRGYDKQCDNWSIG